MHVFHAVKHQLGSPAKSGVPNLASADIRNASRSLVQPQAPLHLMPQPALPRVEAFQARVPAAALPLMQPFAVKAFVCEANVN